MELTVCPIRFCNASDFTFRSILLEPQGDSGTYMMTLAYSLVRNQGAALKACLWAWREAATQSADQAVSPAGRGLKRISAVLRFLQRTTAIPCEARLASIRFRSRRAIIYAPESPLPTAMLLRTIDRTVLPATMQISNPS